MKISLLLLLATISFTSLSQKKVKYDDKLAKELGADEYGMKSYVLVILKTGENTNENERFRDSCFRGHMDNIQRLVKENKLIVAGPLGKNTHSYRGIFIMNVTSIEEAQQLVATDPAVKEGIFEAEYYEWYGSAALPIYLPLSEKITKKQH